MKKSAVESDFDDQLTARVEAALSGKQPDETEDTTKSGADETSKETNTQPESGEGKPSDKEDTNNQKVNNESEIDSKLKQLQEKLEKESEERTRIEKQYKELLAEFTRRSQKLARLEKLADKLESVEDKVGSSQQSSTLTAEEKQVVEQLKKYGVVLQSDVQELLGNLRKEIDTLKNEVKELPEKAATTAITTAELKQELAEIEAVYDGSKDADGIPKPKVDVNKILDFIVQNPSINKKPSEIAKMLFADEFIRYETQKQLAKQKEGNLPKTEPSSNITKEKPDKSGTVLRFDDGTVDKALENVLANLSKH